MQDLGSFKGDAKGKSDGKDDAKGGGKYGKADKGGAADSYDSYDSYGSAANDGAPSGGLGTKAKSFGVPPALPKDAGSMKGKAMGKGGKPSGPPPKAGGWGEDAETDETGEPETKYAR